MPYSTSIHSAAHAFEPTAEHTPPAFVRDAVGTALQHALTNSGALYGSLEALGSKVSAQSPILLRLANNIVATQRVIAKAPAHATTSFSESCFLSYRDKVFGRLTLHFGSAQAQRDAKRVLPSISSALAFRLHRVGVRQRVEEDLHLDFLLLGESDALLDLHAAIDKISTAPYPAVLEFAFGGPDIAVAAALHVSSQRHEGPFTVLHCFTPDFGTELQRSWPGARCGTLLLSSIHLLEPADQRRLLWQLRHAKQQGDDVRILVSTQTSLATLEREGGFCRMLRAELDFLHLSIPHLAERRDDLRHILPHLLEKHSPAPQKQLTAAAWQTLLEHPWNANETELERAAVRLAVMVEADVVDLPELRRAVNWIADPCESTNDTGCEQEHEEVHAMPASLDCELEDEAAETEEPTRSQHESLGGLAQHLVAGNFTGLESLRQGVQRALRFVATNYQEEFTMAQLAREAFISGSHLSFLFKRDLGVPFKTLLVAVRIEKAKQLLLEEPRQSITQICLDSGFGDLSHFERTFKRIVGTNPREFRRRAETPHCPAEPQPVWNSCFLPAAQRNHPVPVPLQIR